MSQDTGAPADADRAATPSEPSPAVSGKAGIPCAEPLLPLNDTRPRIDPADGIEGLAYCADFPSQTMTFNVPRGVYAVPGIYAIKWLRNATSEEFDKYANLPDPNRCPECDAREGQSA